MSARPRSHFGLVKAEAQAAEAGPHPRAAGGGWLASCWARIDSATSASNKGSDDGT